MNYLIFLVSSVYLFGCAFTALPPVQYLEAERAISFSPDRSRIYRPELRIYCHRGKEKNLGQVFQTIVLNFDCDHEDFTQYEGGTPEEVRSHHETENTIFSFNLLSNSRKRVIKLDPFNQTCIGVVSGESYSVRLSLIRIDFWRVLQLAVGIVVFLASAKLSNNAIFYYICGMFLGVFASFLVMVYLASKLFPRKPMMYGVMLGGWTLGIYFAQILFDNLRLIFMTYQKYVFWYILVTGFISFVICYRMGPPKNQRSKNLIKWSLQLAALVAIFFSSAFREASTGVCIAIALFYYFPRSLLYRLRAFYRRRFPPERRFLTNEEYYEQGVRETTKALDELRAYCSSPECKQWSTVLKLKDPARFASFMEGDSHLMDSEILEYETSNIAADISDDDEDQLDGNDERENAPRLEDDSEDEDVQRYRGLQNGKSYPSTSTPTTSSVIRRSLRPSSRSRSRQPPPKPSAPPQVEFSEDED
ncbi:nuclear envelope integral membrane protein [Uranotaenia lowii]|uniref:nuclear envelope integral membrane protein n=1 Tax=Uranotaenia lowii TaxID=190385 RepID=UPI00247929F7|nr:nuclear envelope integral membrane protein [Uranotaenia lowii]